MIETKTLRLLPTRPTPLAAAISLALLAGCSSASGHRLAYEAARSMQDLRGQLLKLQDRVKAVQSSIETFQRESRTTPATFERFRQELDWLESASLEITSRADLSRGQMHEYLTAWEQETNAIQSADLKSRSADRRDLVRAAYLRGEAAHSAARSALAAFTASAGDLRAALGPDLSPAGYEATREWLEKTRARGTEAIEAIAAAAAAFEEQRRSLLPPAAVDAPAN